MANGADRIFGIIKHTSEDMSSNQNELVHLVVKSINPLILTLDDKVEITENFCLFNNIIDREAIEVGDILTAFTFKDKQIYFIEQNDNKPASSGTTDYSELDNKPSINNVELDGNKTGSQLGLVNAEAGKGLSSNDYTDTEKTKLAGIEANANKTIVDNVLDSTSTNPVQNQVLTAKLNELNGKSIYIGSTAPTTNEQVWINTTNNKIYVKNGLGVFEEFYQVVDNLSSNATNYPLSANQGRILKGLIDYDVMDKMNDTAGNDWKEMLRNKIDYCIPLFTRENQSIVLNGGWQNVNFGFAMVTRIGTIYQIVWFSTSGAFYCRKSGSEYLYWSTSDSIESIGNNWYKKEYPDRTEYFKYLEFTYTFWGNGWSWISLANNELELPTGVTFNASTMAFSGSVACSDTAVSLNVALEHGQSYIVVTWRNKYGGDVTNRSFCNFRLTVYK